jgi:ATP-dependent Lon protease
MSLLSKIPFDTYLKPTITREHTPEEIGKYLVSVKDTMDKAVFGHANAKQQIISILAREISNPKSVGNVFAIQGPMGNGKTTLAKEGICKAMNRPFAFISLGGMQDSAFFTGHSYTYEGSKPGRIVEILIETGCMNPVIYFDELDKVSETKHGEEIIHMLCHLTDTTQNSLFQDKYFSGIEFDLSKATFIFSYNDESRINPILLDRMIKIRTDGFDNESKMIIAKKYLLPGLRTQFNFSETDVVFSDEVIKHIMSNYTNDEKGVRNLKRCLDATLSKCNILRYIPSEQQKEMGLAVKGFKLPWTVTIDNIKDFIEKDKSERNPILDMLYL